MLDLTSGYRGKGNGNTRVLDAILARPAFYGINNRHPYSTSFYMKIDRLRPKY